MSHKIVSLFILASFTATNAARGQKHEGEKHEPHHEMKEERHEVHREMKEEKHEREDEREHPGGGEKERSPALREPMGGGANSPPQPETGNNFGPVDRRHGRKEEDRDRDDRFMGERRRERLDDDERKPGREQDPGVRHSGVQLRKHLQPKREPSRHRVGVRGSLGGCRGCGML